MTLSRLQISASAVIAFAVACLSHEVIGHSTACLASGGLISELSSAYFRCRGGGIVSDLGGPLANALVGLACLGLLRKRALDPAVQLTLVLAMAFNFLWLSGCLISSSVAGQSDFAFAARQFGPAEIVVRGLLGVAGIAIALICVRRIELSRAAARTAYIAAGLASCAAALAYVGPVMPAVREAALESFGSMAWLFLVPAGKANAPADIADNPALYSLAALAMLGLFMLGRGF